MRQRGTEWVAIIIAVGFVTGFNLFCFAVLYTAIQNDAPLSENATQVLTGWGGGMVGLLGGFVGGGYVGYRASRKDAVRSDDDHPVDN
jgi:hypothetical protein